MLHFFHQIPVQDKNESRQEEETEKGPKPAVLEAPFVPPCQVKHKDALSALKRVKSESCKRLIYKTACLSEAKKLYNLDMKRTCPVPRDKGSPAKWIDVTSNTPYGNPIRIAFVLTLHGRAFRQVRRLFKALYHNHHYFFFHIDSVSVILLSLSLFLRIPNSIPKTKETRFTRNLSVLLIHLFFSFGLTFLHLLYNCYLLQRSDYLRREVLKMIRNFPNAAVAPWSMATIWGGASLLKMLLKCMEDLMAKKDWKWDFFINLSESDYPIK